MKYQLLIVAALIMSASNAQVPESAAAPKNDPIPVEVHPILHSALALQWNKKIILVDPHGEFQKYEGFTQPSLVLITDIHGDHLDTTILRSLDLSDARIFAPAAVHELLPADLREITTIMKNGDHQEGIGIIIEAVPMYNMPDPNDKRHPKGRGNGYVIDTGGQRIYISGDTEDIPEMRSLKDIDIAFVCMNLPYTMTVEQAASAVFEFKPKIVYPYHYRGKDGFSDVEQFQRLVNEGDTEIEVRLEEWY
jgi:L-ascorbate metabolism protein UlaG (beta-lactamase superfamily)